MKDVFFIILAGGSGQRLWPLSSKKCPKHLIPFLNNKSLLEQTIDRIRPITNKENIWIVTNQEQYELTKKHVNIPTENIPTENILSEPATKNTGPAILWTCHKINPINPEAIMVVLPTDHYIPDKQKFNSILMKAVRHAQTEDKIIIIGIVPTHPAIGYGYIQAEFSDKQNCYPIKKFHEKPDLEKAKQYIQKSDFFWNGGIFIGKVKTFLNEFKIHNPTLLHSMQKVIQNQLNYSELESISIDYTVMEKSKNISVIPADFEWYDVGNLTVFLTLKKQFEKNREENTVNVNSHNNLISTNKKIVVCIGINDLCIVETNDTILIAKQKDTESVKKALPKIKNIYEKAL